MLISVPVVFIRFLVARTQVVSGEITALAFLIPVVVTHLPPGPSQRRAPSCRCLSSVSLLSDNDSFPLTFRFFLRHLPLFKLFSDGGLSLSSRRGPTRATPRNGATRRRLLGRRCHCRRRIWTRWRPRGAASSTPAAREVQGCLVHRASCSACTTIRMPACTITISHADPASRRNRCPLRDPGCNPRSRIRTGKSNFSYINQKV